MSTRPALPTCLDSEKAALGAALVDEKHLATIQAHTCVDHFFLSSHREILRALVDMKAQGKAVDLVTAIEEIRRVGKLEEIGGAVYISGLIDGLPDRPNVDAYARNIRRAAQARVLYTAATLVANRIEQGEWVEDVLAGFEEAKSAFTFADSAAAGTLFVSAPEFITQSPKEVDWLVEGVIESGANGFFSAVPKGGKSWAAVDLAISLALGCDWLGFRVPQAVKVALISREDNPSLTAWRIRNLSAGKSCPLPALLEQNLYINSRRESAELMLDNSRQMAELMVELRSLRPRFVIFDVFNVLHCADENDNQEMRAVLRQLSAIQAEIGCGIGVVHHYNKSDQGSMTQRLRGSSAIAGWAEWLIGISLADEETKIRRMEFELKAAQPPDPVYYRIESTAVATRLERTSYAPQSGRRREGSEAARLMQ